MPVTPSALACGWWNPCQGSGCTGSYCADVADGGGVCAPWLAVTASCNPNPNNQSGCYDDSCQSEPDGGGYCLVPNCDQSW